MSNQSYGRGVPYGMPQYPDQRSIPPRGPTARPAASGRLIDGGYDQSDRQRNTTNHRQGLPSQQHQPQQAQRKLPQNPGLRGPGAPIAQRQQWPLQDSSDVAQNSGSQTRGPPPQRPPRPAKANVPAMLDPPRIASSRGPSGPTAIPQYASNSQPPRENQFDYNGPGIWTEDGYTSPTYPSPNTSRPVTGSSLASTSSSYSVPEAPPPLPQFPSVPTVSAKQTAAQQAAAAQQQQQQLLQQQSSQSRVRPPLGPPPSARRGPSSYYSQQSHVTPIVEETDSQRGSLRNGPESRGSYASSNAIPIGVPDYYLHDAGTPGRERTPRDFEPYASEEDLPIAPPPAFYQEQQRDGSPGLVRQASLGKRSKPTLTTIKSGENLKMGHQRNRSGGSLDEPVSPEVTRAIRPAERAAIAERVLAQPEVSNTSLPRTQTSDSSKASLSVRTGSSSALGKAETSFFDRSSSESEKSELHRQKSKDYLSEPMPDRNARNPVKTDDPRVESILNRLEKGGALGAVASEKSEAPDSTSSLAKRVGSRRPPRLNVNAVQEAEQRGSLTSLPDLIARATKLASNLDRGKTASRLGFNWMDDEKKKENTEPDKRRSGSLSDMLSAFPPPALGTPGSRGSGRFGWPSHLRHSELPSVSDASEAQRRRKKRVCGMPLWLFLFLLLLLILLIAAVVVVPIVLIVLPRQRHTHSASTCQKDLPCSNGGVSIVGSDGACQCLCVNGFTGPTCGASSSTGCTTTSIGGAKDATLGNAIPRLLSGAQSNYSVPLDGQEILGLFSSTNLSCTSENALVTFNGLTARSLPSEVFDDDAADLTTDLLEISLPTKTLQARQATSSTSSGAVETSAGIVFASGSPSSSSSGSSNDNSTQNLDFARVAVLFVLQDSRQLNDAIEAQQAFEDFFTGSSSGTQASNITLQNGYTADLQALSLTVPNGTVVGHT